MNTAANPRPFEARYTCRPSRRSWTPRKSAEAGAHPAAGGERNAVILAHHYQRPEVQEVADCVADSLRLSNGGGNTRGRDRFLRRAFHGGDGGDPLPGENVLLPDLRAGCSLAASITADELRAWKARFPTPWWCVHQYFRGSESGERLLLHVGERREGGAARFRRIGRFCLLPDKFLASVVARQTGRSNIIAYPGLLPRAQDDPAGAGGWMLEEHPDMELLLHPECGCVSSCMAKAFGRQAAAVRTFFLSTEGMLRHIGESPAAEFAVGTELGILHRLRKKSQPRLSIP